MTSPGARTRALALCVPRMWAVVVKWCGHVDCGMGRWWSQRRCWSSRERLWPLAIEAIEEGNATARCG